MEPLDPESGAMATEGPDETEVLFRAFRRQMAKGDDAAAAASLREFVRSCYAEKEEAEDDDL